MRLTELTITRYWATIAVFVALAVVGVGSYFALPINEFPQVNIPVVTVTIVLLVALAAVVLGVALLATGWVSTEFVPQADSGYFSVSTEAPPGTSLAAHAAGVTRRMNQRRGSKQLKGL